MRSIGQLPSLSDGTTFNDFLSREGIEARLETNADGSCELWILDDELIPIAKEHLSEFLRDPGGLRFTAPVKEPSAETTGSRGPKQGRKASPWIRRRADLVRNTEAFGPGPMSILILVACALVFVLTDRGENRAAVLQFTISANWFGGGQWLPEIRAGEIWRLVTPMLVHFGWIHLICNSLMILTLGSLLEARLGSFYLLGFMLVTSAVPNLAQFVVMQSPLFGGISGVAFALAGYAWIRGRQDPLSGIEMPSQNVTMMMIYFVWCWMEQFQLLGSDSLLGGGARVANVVHTAGLLIGCGWGWVDAWRSR